MSTTASTTAPAFSFQGIKVNFLGQNTRDTLVKAIQDVTFDVAPGEFVSIIGPSGCGKSTLLKVAAGLIKPSAGSVKYLGVPVKSIPSGIGYVPQNDSLLPWRNVRHNVGLGLELRGFPREARRDRVDELLSLVGLTAFADKFPHQLSGGMRKRVSLVRALAYRPTAVLMDEPFAALDAQTKLSLHEELIRVRTHEPVTTLFVTHDIEEAILLSDRVVVLSKPPSHVQMIEVIDIPHPRSPTAFKFAETFETSYTRLWEAIGVFQPTEPGGAP